MRKKMIVQNAESAQLKISEMGEKEYLRSADVMKLFSISESTLKNLRNSKELPCYKLGGTYLYKRTEIEACIVRLAND